MDDSVLMPRFLSICRPPQAELPSRIPRRVLLHGHLPHDQEHGQQGVERLADRGRGRQQTGRAAAEWRPAGSGVFPDGR